MPVSEQTAAEMLAEFIAKRGSVPVLKPRKAAGKPEVRERQPKVEFEPDNSRIGCQSHGCYTEWSSPEILAQIWVYEWHLEHEPIKWYVPVAPIIPQKPYVIVRECEPEGEPLARPIQTVSYYQRVTEKPELKSKPLTVRQENESWRNKRIPKHGQRPVVQLSRSSK